MHAQTLLDMLNVTSAKLSAEVERSRKLTARTEFDVTDLSALVTFARRFSKLGPLLVSISSRLPEMFANSRLPSQIHLMKEMLTVIDKVVRGVEASWIESFKADEALLRLPLVADSGAVRYFPDKC